MKEIRIEKLALVLMGACLLFVVGAVLVSTVWRLMVVGSKAGAPPAFAQTPSAGGLQATVNGLCSSCMPSISVWRISEDAAPGDPIGSSCDWFTDNRAPSGPCLAGAIEGITGDLSNSLRVTYHAPATPATYHVPMLRSRSFWNAPSDQECNLRYHDYVFTSVVADDGLRIEV